MRQACNKIRKEANTGRDKRTKEKIKEGGEKKRRRRQSEGGKIEPGRERRPVWVCDELSFWKKILLIPSGYHATSSISAARRHVCTYARVRECVVDHVTPSKDLELTSGGQDLTPLPTPHNWHTYFHTPVDAHPLKQQRHAHSGAHQPW